MRFARVFFCSLLFCHNFLFFSINMLKNRMKYVTMIYRGYMYVTNLELHLGGRINESYNLYRKFLSFKRVAADY